MLLFSTNQPQTATALVGTINAVNANLGSADKRLVTMNFYTNGATNTGGMNVNMMNSGTIGEVYNITPTLFTSDIATKINGNLTLGTAGNRFFVTEGSNAPVGQTTLVLGTKAITINGLTTSSRCFLTLVSQGGTVTTTADYACVCTTNTATITALTTGNVTNTTDTSILNYWIVN